MSISFFVPPCLLATGSPREYNENTRACGALPADAEEIVSVDMGCVGKGLACTERMVSICAKDSNGPYDYGVTTELIRCAEAGTCLMPTWERG